MIALILALSLGQTPPSPHFPPVPKFAPVAIEKKVPAPPKQGPCSSACTCGCVATGICACNAPRSTPKVTPQVIPVQTFQSIPGLNGGCYIDSQGRQVCPLKRK